MSVKIDTDKCVGCGRCASVCPGTLISVENGKAVMNYPKDCWGCVSCVKECPCCAIKYYLGADIGGKGSVLSVKQDVEILRWTVEKADGTTEVIEINRKDANKY